MTNSGSTQEKILRRIPLEILGLSVLLALPALFLFDGFASLLIIAGGAFSALNFVWLNRSLTGILLSGKTKALKSALPLFGVRLLLILAVFFIIIFLFSKKVLAFVAGFSMVIPVFMAEAILALTQMKQWKN